MAKLQKNFSLKDCNTLRFDVSAQYYTVINTLSELQELLSNRVAGTNKILVLGSGSNILFTKDYQGLVLKVNIKGINVVYEDKSSVHVEIGAGEDWPSVVEYVVSKGWGGIENLALVPGTAGAAPVQNIACYGHNLHETLLSVNAINISNNSAKTFHVNQCGLGYRTSIFKTDLHGQYVIVKILLKLQKQPILNTGYRSRYESIENELSKMSRPPYKIGDVYQAVVNIRKNKLPDVNKVGTVGSVFKNPLISQRQLEELRGVCPDIHCYPKDHLTYHGVENQKRQPDEMVKIPAAWLIDDMGWAGKRIGNCGIWKTQPLNIVNHGHATPTEYLTFVKMVKDAVFEKYSIQLETEVVII